MTDERFSRIERMIGPEGLDRLGRAHVAVIGLGAVGSYALEALARAGVGRLRLVDFDTVQPSNINRQLLALQSTLGQPKVEIARRRVQDINPDCVVEAMQAFVHVETLDAVLAGPPDLVIDAIDAVLPKVELLAAAAAGGIPVVSAMGAALRTDPTALRVDKLSRTRHCPLARQVRKLLRRRGRDCDFLCVYSTEPVNDLHEDVLALPQDSDEPLVKRGRKRRTMGSLPTLTGIFGLAAANAALGLLLEGQLVRRTGVSPARG